MDKKNKMKKTIDIVVKIGLILGVLVGFYKLPSTIAEKIAYQKIKNTPVNQEFTEEKK